MEGYENGDAGRWMEGYMEAWVDIQMGGGGIWMHKQAHRWRGAQVDSGLYRYQVDWLTDG